MDRISRLWYRISSTFWFLPTLIVTGAGVLAIVAIEADARFVASGVLEDWPRLFGAGASASRSMLSAVAGSMITVAGTVFSITLVALSLASSQYSSRVLRNFMRDHVNQAVLGVFVGIFAYCLIVLRSIHGSDDDAFVPSVAVFVGLLLGFGGIAVLVFFIHHIARSIQASQIVEAVRSETCAAIERLFPVHVPGTAHAAAPATPVRSDTWHAVAQVRRGGYLQFVDYAQLRDAAIAHGVCLKVHPEVGDYLLEGDAMLSASPNLPPGLAEAVCRCWSVGAQRTLEQDVGFGIRQLVDVALRALSPGVNDATTAIMCIDACTAVLACLESRDLRFDGCQADGVARVETRHPDFSDLVDDAFEQIRHSGRDDAAVLQRLCWALAKLSSRTRSESHRAVFRRHADRLQSTVTRDLHDPGERARLQAALATVADAAAPK